MDLAPDHAGIIQGLVNTVGNCAGFGTDKRKLNARILSESYLSRKSGAFGS